MSRQKTFGSVATTIDPAGEVEAATAALTSATIDALWRQWAALGAAASVSRRATAVVDPEALILASLWFRNAEPRLGDLLAAWTLLNSHLLSVQRIKNLASFVPPTVRLQVQQGLSALARLAHDTGKDFRWKALIDERVAALEPRPGKALSIDVHGTAADRLTRVRRLNDAPIARPQAVMLRLRALLGVGMRADIIAFMACTRKRFVTSEQVAHAAGYNATAVRRLLDALVAAGGLARVGEYVAYSIHGAPLGRLIEPRERAQWEPCADLYAAVIGHVGWWALARSRVLSPFALGERAEKFAALYDWVVDAENDELTPPTRFESQHDLMAELENLTRILRERV